MTALTEFLYPAPARRDIRSIVAWWERRRLPFNLAVGAAGLLSWGLSTLLFLLPPNGVVGVIPWQAALAFGVMANVCYGFGALSEVILEKAWRGRLYPTGPALYRMGLTFSVGLALLPALWSGFVWGFRILAALFF